jgi:hypothetical protein
MGDVASDFAAADAATVAQYGPGSDAVFPYICAMLAAGFSPTGPDLYHSQWVTANGDMIDFGAFAGLFPQYANLIGTTCPLPTFPGQAVPSQPPQPCPAGWTGTFPSCTPSAAAIASAVPVGPVTSPSPAIPTPITNPTPVTSAPTSPSGSTIINSSGAAAATTSPASTSITDEAESWLTGSMFGGIPNWGLVAAGVGLLLVLVGGKR